MAILVISFWTIITYFLILEKVEAQFSCELLDGVMIECKYDNTTSDRFVLKKQWLPVSDKAVSLVMSSCSIERCDVDVFEELPVLLLIDMSSNFLGEITEGTFDTVPELEELDLSDNYIDYIPVNLFQRNHKLKILNLNDNMLHRLELTLFNSLVNFMDLDLSKNRFRGQNLSSELFLHIVNINSIKFSNNVMTDTPSNLLSTLNNLETIALDQCRLSEIPSFLMAPNLKTLKYLTLKDNDITKIDRGVFDHLYNLVSLALSRNKLEYIDEYSLRNLSHLRYLSLNGNSLIIIPQKLFMNTPKLTLLNLSRNIITNLPDDLFKKTNIRYLNISYNKLTYLQLNFCKQQQNPRALKIFTLIHNPWQCTCLRELLSELNDLDVGYHTNHFKRDKPVCATTTQLVCKRDESLNSFYVDLFNSSAKRL